MSISKYQGSSSQGSVSSSQSTTFHVRGSIVLKVLVLVPKARGSRFDALFLDLKALVLKVLALVLKALVRRVLKVLVPKAQGSSSSSRSSSHSSQLLVFKGLALVLRALVLEVLVLVLKARGSRSKVLVQGSRFKRTASALP